MLRFEISEATGALPAIDLDDEVVILGSGMDARLRLPADVAAPFHIRFDGHAWMLLAETRISGMVRAAGDSGPVGHGMVLELGRLRVRVGPAPSGATATPTRRIALVARELARGALADGAPALEIERGPEIGARRALPAMEGTLVIGRGGAADWAISDDGLADRHAELRRAWDGVTITDLGERHGTRVDGKRLTAPAELRDGAQITLGRVRLRYHDPAERQLRGPAPLAPPAAPRAWWLVALAIALALAAALWLR